jgi:hypothetical protein
LTLAHRAGDHAGMSYDFWILAAQGRQIQIAQQQVRQLGAIHDQLARQNFIQQQQAALAHTLFELETFVRKVTRIAQADPFAAGVLSRVRLNTMQGLTPDLFMQIEHKRSWAYATETLAGCWRAIEHAPMAHRIVQAVHDLISWQGRLGPNPHGRLVDLEKKADGASTILKIAAVAMALGIVIGGFMALGGIGMVNAARNTQDIDAGRTVIVVGLAAVGGGITFAAVSWEKAKRTRVDADGYAQQLGTFNAWMGSPEGGGLLNEAVRRHPLLNA